MLTIRNIAGARIPDNLLYRLSGTINFSISSYYFLIVEVQAVNDTPTVIGINRTQDGSISVIKGPSIVYSLQNEFFVAK